MPPNLPKSVANVVRQWRDRLVWLEASLRDNPHQFEAWSRHIQVKVLTFLVRRYADQRNVTGPRLDELFRPTAVPSFYSRPRNRPVRRAADFLPPLRRIAQANRG